MLSLPLKLKGQCRCELNRSYIGLHGQAKKTGRCLYIMKAAASLSALDNGYFFSLRAFWTTAQFKLDMLAFVKRSVAVVWVQNVFKVYENIGALFLFDKAETLVCVKPFNGAGSHCSRHD